MKVSYKLVGVGGYTTLFDLSAAPVSPVKGRPVLREFAPAFTPGIQAEPLAGGPSQFREPRSNVACRLVLSFNIEYVSAQAALASIRQFADVASASRLLDVKLHLKVEEGGEVDYYPNAAVSNYAAALMSVSCDHAFDFSSDNVTLTAPTT